MRRRDTDGLADELRRALRLLVGPEGLQVLEEAHLLHGQGLAVAESCCSPDQTSHDGESRASTDGLAAREEHARFPVPPSTCQKFGGEARLPDARRCRHEHEASHAVVGALGEGCFEEAELLLSSDGRRRFSEKGSPGVEPDRLSYEQRARSVSLHHETPAE